MTNLLSLSLEIRRMIYTHALVVGHIYPYFKTQHINYPCYSGDYKLPQFQYSHEQVLYELPNVQLLQTCRLVYQEASPILYSKNQILLPILDLTLRFFNMCLHTPERCSWVKSVGLRLESSDMYEHERKIVFDRECANLRSESTRMHFPNKAAYTVLHEDFMVWGQALHVAYKRHLTEVIWPRKVAPLLENLALDSLDLRMDVAHCHSDCCYMTNSALSSFTPGFAKGSPNRVNFSGYPEDFWDKYADNYFDFEHSDDFFSEAITTCMERWTQQREKSSYSMKQGFRWKKQILHGITEEEEEEGDW
ncbi:hypothetical protein MMC17_000398 [Xylographa soralifera]|nr:hypothetical protein [Xylographa soralifera]